MRTTACKRLFSLGCAPHTDGAVFQAQLLKQQQQAMRDQYQAPGFKEGEVISLDSDDD